VVDAGGHGCVRIARSTRRKPGLLAPLGAGA
jgi:hypothetical protein